MMRKMLALALVFALAACGQGGGGGAGAPSAANNEACQMLGDPAPLFGANATMAGYRGIEQMAASCEFASADGTRAGEIVTFTTASLGAGTPLTAKMQEILQKWDAQTETPLAPVAGLEGAQIATNLPGYQSQIAFIKGDTLVLIQARTPELESAPSADLATRVATTVAAGMH